MILCKPLCTRIYYLNSYRIDVKNYSLRALSKLADAPGRRDCNDRLSFAILLLSFVAYRADRVSCLINVGQVFVFYVLIRAHHNIRYLRRTIRGPRQIDGDGVE